MSEKRQKNQLELAFTGEGRSEAPKPSGEGTETLAVKRTAKSPAANERWMEEVRERENCKRAWARVKANKGGPGVDAMTVQQLPDFLQQHWPAIREQLLSGTCQPQPVKRVEIPKPDGGVRKLGVPAVLDRFIQQVVCRGCKASGSGGFPNTATGFVPGARRIRRWSKRGSIGARAAAGWWTWIWRSFSTRSTTTKGWRRSPPRAATSGYGS